MAARSSSSSLYWRHKLVSLVTVILLLSMLIASCSATRPGALMMMRPQNDGVESGGEQYLTSFKYEGQALFSFLPKGVPLPPSGPSMRHN
ncbi:hypothetical protein LINPERPRIM_LOCUS23086 [Linum perenne]